MFPLDRGLKENKFDNNAKALYVFSTKIDAVFEGKYFKFSLLTKHALAFVFSSFFNWETSLKKVSSFSLALVRELIDVKNSESSKSEIGFILLLINNFLISK